MKEIHRIDKIGEKLTAIQAKCKELYTITEGVEKDYPEVTQYIIEVLKLNIKLIAQLVAKLLKALDKDKFNDAVKNLRKEFPDDTND